MRGGSPSGCRAPPRPGRSASTSPTPMSGRPTPGPSGGPCAVLRAAGPRRGWITRARFDETAAWAAGDLIDGQIDYHRRQHVAAENIERSLGWTENTAFLVLMAVLLVYLTLGSNSPHWFAGLVTLVSAFAPAVAAGCLALEATNGFRELKERNARLAGAFEAEKARLDPIERRRLLSRRRGDAAGGAVASGRRRRLARPAAAAPHRAGRLSGARLRRPSSSRRSGCSPPPRPSRADVQRIARVDHHRDTRRWPAWPAPASTSAPSGAARG